MDDAPRSTLKAGVPLNSMANSTPAPTVLAPGLHIKEKPVLNLIGQYLRRMAERGGEFFECEQGISP